MYSVQTNEHFTTFVNQYLGRISFPIIMLLLSFSTTSICQDKLLSPGIFYKVTKPGIKDTSYLFGSYHLVKESYLGELPRVKKAFENTKGVIVETSIDPLEMHRLQAMGTMKNKLITDLLEKPLTDSLNSELTNTLGIDLTAFNQLKPINIILTLSVVHLMNNNKILHQYSGEALDAYFALTGKSKGKIITTLETMDEQMNIIFNHMSEKEQANQLAYFLRNKDFIIKQGDLLLQSWFNNDLNEIYAVYKKLSEAGGQSDFLLSTRNDSWMRILPGLIDKESQFIAVGTLHLGGTDGLLALLTQKGYIVTPTKL